MGPYSVLIHICNFVLPALVVGGLVALFAPWVLKRKGAGWLRQTAFNALAGILALGGGLWFFGTDAKMATYLALVALVASCQWVSVKGWQG